jgi:DNA-binding MarR family transcriptional regulator
MGLEWAEVLRLQPAEPAAVRRPTNTNGNRFLPQESSPTILACLPLPGLSADDFFLSTAYEYRYCEYAHYVNREGPVVAKTQASAARYALRADLGSLIDTAAGFTQLYERWIRLRLGNGQGGLTPARLRILFLLHEGGPQKMTEIARKAHLAPRSLTALIDGLEKECLAERRAHQTDRRAIVVTLTAAGLQAVEERSGPYWDAKNFLFGALSAEERQVMVEIYNRWTSMIATDLKQLGDD